MPSQVPFGAMTDGQSHLPSRSSPSTTGSHESAIMAPHRQNHDYPKYFVSAGSYRYCVRRLPCLPRNVPALPNTSDNRDSADLLPGLFHSARLSLSKLPVGPGAPVMNRPCRLPAEAPWMATRRQWPAGALRRSGREGRKRPTGSRQRLCFCLPVKGE